MNKHALAQLIEHARRVRDDAAADSAGAQREAAQAQQTLELLSRYMQDHLGRAPVRRNTDASMLNVREHFTRKLDAAIDEQSRTRDELQQAADQRRAELIERQRKLLAFEALQERRETRIQQKRAAREQRATDESAMQAAMRRNRSNTDGY